MYADVITGSMERALAETARRREVQLAYNRERGLEPVTINKVVRETVRAYEAVQDMAAQYSDATAEKLGKDGQPIRIEDIPILISSLERDMKDLAKAMEFEKAAGVRDEIQAMRKLLGTSDGHLGVEKRKFKRQKTARY
jgi:excinuclease ABC subunit B